MTAKQKKQKMFIKYLEANYGNIKKSCEEAGISRKTFYNWKKEEEFMEELKLSDEFAMEDKRDVVEDKLMEKVLAGDTQSIIFASKTINRSRGYGDKLDIKSEFEPITIVFPDFSKDTDDTDDIEL